jgi:hypothetical protein
MILVMRSNYFVILSGAKRSRRTSNIREGAQAPEILASARKGKRSLDCARE